MSQQEQDPPYQNQSQQQHPLRRKTHNPYAHLKFHSTNKNKSSTTTTPKFKLPPVPTSSSCADAFLYDHDNNNISPPTQEVPSTLWLEQFEVSHFPQQNYNRREQSWFQQYQFLCNHTNYLPACAAANAFNIHTILTSLGLITVPYCYAGSPQYDLSLPSEGRDAFYHHHQHQHQQQPRVKLFIGHLPLVLITTNIIALLVKSLTGVTPLRIYFTHPSGATGTNQNGKVTSGLAVVEVLESEAELVIANLHRRVIFDQTSFHVAITDDQTRRLQRVTKLLETNHSIRFNGRPYSTVLVTREQPKGQPRQKNLYNPLCKCDACRDFKNRNTNFDFLLHNYIPDILQEFSQVDPCTPFRGDKLLLTHAYLIRSNLTDDQNKHYSDVYKKALEDTRRKTSDAYPQVGTELFEDITCAAVQQQQQF